MCEWRAKSCPDWVANRMTKPAKRLSACWGCMKPSRPRVCSVEADRPGGRVSQERPRACSCPTACSGPARAPSHTFPRRTAAPCRHSRSGAAADSQPRAAAATALPQQWRVPAAFRFACENHIVGKTGCSRIAPDKGCMPGTTTGNRMQLSFWIGKPSHRRLRHPSLYFAP